MPIPIEVDHFPDTLATVELTCPNLPMEVVRLRGPTTVEVDLAALGDTEPVPDGREQVPTEIVDLHLVGVSPTLGLITLRQSPILPSLGEIEEVVNNTPGVLDLRPFTPTGAADSFFDVFFEVDVPGAGLLLHNRVPKRLQTHITHKPPATGEAYEGLAEIELYDPNGEPTGCILGASRHIPACPGGLDTDQDGIPDACDYCTLISNVDQRDTDRDGYGNICDPDFDNNLVVNAADLAFFKTKFFSSDPDADLNGDGVVNAADLAILKTMFFKAPGPSGLVP